MTMFHELGISEKIMKSIQAMGFEEATPIQSETIPVSLQGKDVIGQAQTGTGKTAAFGIPMLEKMDLKNGFIQGIVIAPTRELAIQVAEELNRIGQYKGVKALPIYGGQDINRQIRALKNRPQIIVGTPGRLMDHMNRKTIRLQNIQVVVLDEADEMLNMGFVEDIENILKEVPEVRQTLLFSATMPEPIRKIAEKFMKDPVQIKVKAKEMTVPNIEQYYIETQEKKKFDVLTRLLDMESPELAIVFGRTKRRVDELSEALNSRGYAAEGIHGDLTQAKRSSVLKKFKAGTIEVLVATDVAARGLDISGVTHVYNFDIPQDPESYVHRIGRTGRAGKQGLAYTFVTPREIGQLKNIERTTKRSMERKPVPSMDDALEGQKQITAEKILYTIQNENFSFYKHMAEELLDEHDSVTVVAAAIKLLTKEPDQTPVQLTAEAPVIAKDRKPRGGGDNRSRDNYSRDNRRRDGGGSRGKGGSYQRNSRGRSSSPSGSRKKTFK